MICYIVNLSGRGSPKKIYESSAHPNRDTHLRGFIFWARRVERLSLGYHHSGEEPRRDIPSGNGVLGQPRRHFSILQVMMHMRGEFVLRMNAHITPTMERLLECSYLGKDACSTFYAVYQSRPSQFMRLLR